ncbi:MAG: rubrerythrin [Actinobacteria bacterium]|jgi:rubrerythrin|nr:rubrerythrin [Actinomycetota bacterium]
MADLEGSRTLDNLRAAFALEAQSNRRYLWFAQQADVEGLPEVAELFRSIAESETGHAIGHLEFLADSGDPATGAPIGSSRDNLRSAMLSEQREAEEIYRGFAESARSEGFADLADWFELVRAAEARHAERFRAALDRLDG